jgi:hypothetical protein
MFRITIEKYHASSGEYWVNRYHHGGSSMADAVTAGNALVAAELMVHHSSVLFTKFRVDDAVPNTDVFQTVPLNLNGNSGNTGDIMPLFVCARVDIEVAGGGRPSRKFFRGALTEQMVTGMKVEQLFVDQFKTRLNTAFTTLGLVDVDGQLWTSVAPSPIVGEHQLRRGSKKKVTP